MSNRHKHLHAVATYQELLATDEQARAGGDAWLTDSGIHRLTQLVAAAKGETHPAAQAPPGTRPDWDVDRHVLSFGGHELHEFLQEAERQTCLLAAFQAVGWTDRPIPNPMPTEPWDKPRDLRRRLHDAVKKLNANLPPGVIRFRVRRDHVFWERYSPPSPA